MMFSTEFTEAQLREAKALANVLDGATALCMTACKIETACRQAGVQFVVLKRTDMESVAKAMRLAAQMIDMLSIGVEQHEQLSRVMKRR